MMARMILQMSLSSITISLLYMIVFTTGIVVRLRWMGMCAGRFRPHRKEGELRNNSGEDTSQ